MSVLGDYIGLDLGQLANAAVQYQSARNQSNASADSATIDQLKGTVGLYQMQNQALYDALGSKAASASASGVDTKTLIQYGFLAAAAFVVYKLVK